MKSSEGLLSGLICDYEYLMNVEENWLWETVSKAVCRTAEDLNAKTNCEMCVDVVKCSLQGKFQMSPPLHGVLTLPGKEAGMVTNIT